MIFFFFRKRCYFFCVENVTKFRFFRQLNRLPLERRQWHPAKCFVENILIGYIFFFEASRDILGANRVGMWSIYYKLSAKTRRGRNSLHNDQEYVSANDVCGPSHDLLPDIKLSNLCDLPETISNLKEKPLNQIQVGVYMRESKVKSLRKYDFWDLPHRNDIKFCFIDPDKEIRRDYDVILQKATTWFAEAEYFPDM